MTPARVLALQRSAGNAAVTAMLQRQEKEKTPVAGPGDFGVSGGAPQVGGTVTAKPDGDGVRAESPDVKYEPAKVWLQEGKTLGGSQNFGFVQNLVTSTRGAVYRRGGDPAGDITSEPREGHGKAYDAVSDPNDDTKINKRVFPPFYWPPSTMNDDNVAASPAETDPAAHDQPGFTLPAKEDDGRLTEFTGADQFKLGVAVKKGDAVVHPAGVRLVGPVGHEGRARPQRRGQGGAEHGGAEPAQATAPTPRSARRTGACGPTAATCSRASPPRPRR